MTPEDIAVSDTKIPFSLVAVELQTTSILKSRLIFGFYVAKIYPLTRFSFYFPVF